MDTKILYAKLATVPTPIKSWLGSENVIDFIDGLERQFNLPDGSSGTIGKLIQRLQIKDLAPQNFSGQLALELKLDKNKTLLIADAMKNVIFIPIQKDLTNYGIDISLLEKFEMVIAHQKIGPAITESIKIDDPVMMSVVPAVVPVLPKPKLPVPLVPATPSKVEGMAQKPLSDKGWSTMKMSDIASPQPKPVVMPMSPQDLTKKSFGSQPTGPVPMPRSTFNIAPAKVAPIGTGVTTPTPKAPPAAPQKAVPMPMMMVQGNNAPKPIKNAPDFRITGTSMENIMVGSASSAPRPLKPAILEMGGQNSAGSPMLSTNSGSGIPRVVHYSDLKSSLPTPMSTAKPPLNESGRNVVEMTAMTLPSQPSMMAKPMPMDITAKPGIMPVPRPGSTPPASANLTLSVAPMRPSQPLSTPIPVPVPPAAPKPMNVGSQSMPAPAQTPSPLPPPPAPKQFSPQIPLGTQPKPLPGKVIVKDFTEGR